MSRRFLRHGAVFAGLALLGTGLAAWLSAMLPAGLLAAQGAAEEENPFAVSTKPDTKPAPQPKKAVADPFRDRGNPFDPSAVPTKAAAKSAAKGRAAPGAAKGERGTTGSRRTIVESIGGEAAIEQALLAATDADFDATPLADVIEHLTRIHHIPIVLDRKALEDASIDPTTANITFSLHGLTLRSALYLVLRPLGLTWTIRSEVLFITTEDAARNMLITKVYDVADLVRCRDEKDMPWDDYDSLIDAIEITVQPDSWMETGAGVGSVAPLSFGNTRVLIVSNTYQVQTAIAKLLEDLRKIGAKAAPDQKPPLRQRPNSAPPPGQGSGTNPPRGAPGFM